MLLIIFGDGVVAGVLLRNSKAENSGWIVITFGWAMGVAIAVYAVGRISGAHINPAVTIGLASIGAFDWVQVPGYIIAQFLGAFVGAVPVWLAYLPHWEETADPGLKLGVFCTAPAIYRTVPNLITEIIGTAVLVFGVLGIVSNAQQIQQASDVDLSSVYTFGVVPLIVGLLVLGIGLDRKSTRLNSSHANISYAVFCLKKKNEQASADRDGEPLPRSRADTTHRQTGDRVRSIRLYHLCLVPHVELVVVGDQPLTSPVCQ